MSTTFLVTNDDGIHAEGLKALREAVAPLGRVVTVAPDREQSAASHAITLHHPLRVREVAPDTYAVDGTPTDCVLVAMHGLLEKPPDFVLSGINHGPNMGDDVSYSGTVSAAIEGAILGVPSLAFSLAAYENLDFTAAALVPRIVQSVTRHGLPGRALLNVNIPSGSPADVRGIRLTRLGHRVYADQLVTRTDPRGRTYHWIGGTKPSWRPDPDTDFTAIQAGYVSVTPISLDMTHLPLLEAMKAWRFDDG